MENMTDTTEDTGDSGPLENWFLLMDPAWAPSEEDELPPAEAVVGLWPVEADGRVGRFRANPDYVPADEHSPTDPLDAVLRLVLHGGAEVEHIQLMLRDCLFDIAMNGDGKPLVVQSPDDIACVVVATAEPHRRRVSSPQWRRIDLDELVMLLADGVDVLFNPGGPASVRLTGDFMRETFMMSDDEVSAVHERFRQESGVRVVPWGPGQDETPAAQDSAAPRFSTETEAPTAPEARRS
ncbi:hypothetical protein SAMN04488000_109276 [Lentzea albida]|uniref:SseB protein N-terminal domain-containing protein n=2 Tax=Lentzea albida TaxID=65499 RepID=A0A1H9PWY7_9PSEU|nr:hypothetical protein SAMN04488000_109276 [Lentzea albida]